MEQNSISRQVCEALPTMKLLRLQDDCFRVEYQDKVLTEFCCLSNLAFPLDGYNRIQGVVAANPADITHADAIADAGDAVDLIDDDKAWTANEFQNMYVEITAGTGIGEYNRILANGVNTITADFTALPDATTEYRIIEEIGAGTAEIGIMSWIQDTSKSWSIDQFLGMYVQITAGTGSGQEIEIESNTADTIYAIFSIIPDATSAYLIIDVHDSGTAESGTLTELTDTDFTWTVNEYVGFYVEITAGTGVGQYKQITANTADTLTAAFDIAPDATSEYRIVEEVENGTVISAEASALQDIEATWTINQLQGMYVEITAGTGMGQYEEIISNEADTIYAAFDVIPDATSAYVIKDIKDNGVAESGLAINLKDADQAWTPDAFVGYTLNIVGGTGEGQSVEIISNTEDSIMATLTTPLDETSEYTIVEITPATVYKLFDNQFDAAVTPTTQTARGIMLFVFYPERDDSGVEIEDAIKNVKLKLYYPTTETFEIPVYEFFSVFNNPMTDDPTQMINKIEVINENAFDVEISSLVLLVARGGKTLDDLQIGC